jgi:pimeloyl-ACP methyl ester carboxylesterase
VIPVVFGPSGQQLMGIYHAAEPGVARGSGIVLCNPLGYEAMCTHRTYRHLARRLAAAGFDVLRFDYHGTGDSSGGGDEPDRLGAWVDSVGLAIDELRALAGVSAVDLFGVRLGATLATLAAARRSDIRSLVLWAPVVSGRTYAREVRALQMLTEGGERREAGGAGGQDDGDSLEPILRELAGASLLTPYGRIASRALILARDDLPIWEERLAAHLRQCGVETELRAAPGYARMVDHPETAVVPSFTLDAIVAWLGSAESGTAPHRAVTRAPSSVLTFNSQAPLRAVREEALSFGDGHRLFGILTERDESRSGHTAVVFLNAGANHRVGPNRLYVSLARDLAARGYPAFRFDAGGIGDGAPPPGTAENRVYSKDSVADVKAAMTYLTSIRDVRRFVLVGICSGGFLAFHTSADDARVAGQIIINPQTFEWRRGDPLTLTPKRSFKSTRYYLQAIWRPATWTLALRGEIDFRGVAGALQRRSIERIAVRLKGAIARWRGLPEPRSEVERVFRAVSDRGVRSLLIFSSQDGGLDMIERHLGTSASSMAPHANFRLEIVDGADHTFTPRRSQDRLRALVTRFVESDPGGAADQRPAPSATAVP